jgi:ketosteroid isomerase-like protein
MQKRVKYGVAVSILTAAAVLTTPMKSAIAQDCTEQLAKDFLVGWSNDLPTLIPLFTDNVVYEDTTVHAVLHGKDELRGFAEGWFKAFPDLSFALTSTLISGDRAVVAWQVTGTQRRHAGNARLK